ncbi:uncharacterized protein LOC132554447 [Ylistrum balloti]|uniref:uncharacterized protein LOC132554447 n=1 Tax=Ylistrum balloti TaxID=509963 RepID=UPI002905E641|nr:uncharacterized protein LOC132554447 [Ylistrum balloti]
MTELGYPSAKAKHVSNAVPDVHLQAESRYPDENRPRSPVNTPRRGTLTRPHKMLREVVESKFLLRHIQKLSPVHHTYGLEVFHSVVNNFAPKSTHIYYPAMVARLSIVGQHFNENGKPHQATTLDGQLCWRVSYPKGKKGKTVVVKLNITAVTYYIDNMRQPLMERRRLFPSYQEAVREANKFLGYKPPAVTSFLPKVDKRTLILQRRSRFANVQNNGALDNTVIFDISFCLDI